MKLGKVSLPSPHCAIFFFFFFFFIKPALYFYLYQYSQAFLVAQTVKNLSAMWETWV